MAGTMQAKKMRSLTICSVQTVLAYPCSSKNATRQNNELHLRILGSGNTSWSPGISFQELDRPQEIKPSIAIAMTGTLICQRRTAVLIGLFLMPGCFLLLCQVLREWCKIS